MPNLFKAGFASLPFEYRTEQLSVQGTIPVWLRGTLVRNGPGRFEVGEQKIQHWFDGFSLLHRYTFEAGNISYATRFLDSEDYRESLSTGVVASAAFIVDAPSTSTHSTLTIDKKPATNANVSVSKFAGRYVALTETPMMVEFEPITLEAKGAIEFSDNISGQLTTAHPHYDLRRNTVINYITQLGLRSMYQFYYIEAASLTRKLIASVPVTEPAYAHSFAMTEKYIIFAEFPLVVAPLEMVISGKPLMDNFSWKPERGTRLLVISKQDGRIVRTYQTEAFFAFHHINAFEVGDDIFMDVVAYQDSNVLGELYLTKLRQSGSDTDLTCGEVRRYHLQPGQPWCDYEVLSRQLIELPRFNYAGYSTQKYRYIYGVGSRRNQSEGFYNQLVKIDTNGQALRSWHKENCYPGEPVFVAAPQARSEDEGVVLSVILDGLTGTSFLLILEGQTFEEIGRASLNHSLPFGFHGEFFENLV